ncbi:PRD domain-containing protein [Pediococcus cellicola]|nr:PRD domain-containing protein [Pediococcus cellicola]GEL15890.1 transcription antiterminator LicT [Pediococcus cellicola]
MRITKILNNNVIEAKDESSNQVIVIGRGIGHDRKRGDNISQNEVEEMFIMTNKKLFPTVKNLLTTVSTDLIETSNKIVNYGQQKLGHKINQNIIITLTDHLNYAVRRTRDGFNTPNPLNRDIKKFYPVEYEIGEYARKVVKKYQFTDLSEDEAGFVAMHFVDASIGGKEHHNVAKITKIVELTLSVVDRYIVKPELNSLSYSRFIRHIQYLAIRLLDNVETEVEIDGEIKDLVFKKYPQELKIAQSIKVILHEKFNLTIGNSELMYITMHLVRLLKVGSDSNET